MKALPATTAAKSSLPMDQLLQFKEENKELRVEVQKLKEALHESSQQQQQAAAAAAAVSFSSNQTNQNNLLTIFDENQPITSSSSSSAPTAANVNNSFADPKKYNERLKLLFKDKITIFRKAVQLLTGYEVTVTPFSSSSSS
jgi:CRISPR/Cas system endoribonuclease Cas6 (RAMP superfamily)